MQRTARLEIDKLRSYPERVPETFPPLPDGRK